MICAQAELDKRSRIPESTNDMPAMPDWLAYLHAAPLIHTLSLILTVPQGADAAGTSTALAPAAYATAAEVLANDADAVAAAEGMLRLAQSSPAIAALPEAALLAAMHALHSMPVRNNSAAQNVKPKPKAAPKAAARRKGGKTAPLAITTDMADPSSGDSFAVALVDALLAHDALAETPVATYRGIAARSAALSCALLPLLLATAATSPAPADAPSDDTPAARLAHDLSDFLTEQLFPPLAIATDLLQGDAGRVAAPAGRAAAKLAQGSAAQGVAAPGRIEAMRLMLQCLGALRSLSAAARLTLTAFGHQRCTEAKAEAASAQHVLSWETTFWLDMDAMQLAAASVLCGDFYGALPYVELWATEITGAARLPSLAQLASLQPRSQAAAAAGAISTAC